MEWTIVTAYGVDGGGGGAARRAGVAVAAVMAGLLGAAPAARAGDIALAEFFALWDRDAGVTPTAVRSLYARSVSYYGRQLDPAGVYADKRSFARRWPDRRYALVPGSVVKGCDPEQSRCRVSATLAWHAASAARRAAAGGRTRVTLDLVRQDGELKIARETGRRATSDE